MNILWATQQPNKSWFEQYGWIITAILAGILFIALIVMIVMMIRESKKEKQIAEKVSNDKYFECFGGKDNIVSCEAKGSRLVVVLKDYSKLNEEELKNVGIQSLIKATDKVTLIVGSKAKELSELIEKK